MNYESIHELCASPNATVEQIREFIHLGSCVNALGALEADLNPRALTPLMHASRANTNAEVIQFLIDAGADVKMQASGTTALHEAASANPNPDVTAILLRSGAEVNTKNDAGVPALYLASFWNNAAVNKILIDAGAEIVFERSTALHNAARQGELELVNLLLDEGADIDQQDDYLARTPIMDAAKECQVDVVWALIEKGADLDRRCRSDWTALHYAIDGNGSSEQWSRERVTEIVKLLLAEAINVNGNSEDTADEISVAVRCGDYNPEVVDLLIRAGARIDHVVRGDGMTPIQSACSRVSWAEDTRIVDLLLEAGASPIDKGGYGGSKTPSELVAEHMRTENPLEPKPICEQILRTLETAAKAQKKKMRPPTLLERVHRLFE